MPPTATSGCPLYFSCCKSQKYPNGQKYMVKKRTTEKSKTKKWKYGKYGSFLFLSNDIHDTFSTDLNRKKNFYFHVLFFPGFIVFPESWCRTSTDSLFVFVQYMHNVIHKRDVTWLKQNFYLVSARHQDNQTNTNREILVDWINSLITNIWPIRCS